MRDISANPELYSINTGTLGYKDPLEKIIELCSQKGIGWISPWRAEIAKTNIDDIAKLLKEKNIKVSSLCRSTYYTAKTKQERLDAIEENRQALYQAEKIKASCYMQVVGSLSPGEKDLEIAREQVKEGIYSLLNTSKDTGVAIAIEPLHPMTCGDRSCITTLKEALDLCDDLDPTHKYNLGVAVDVYHTWWDAALYEQIKRAGKRILAYHVSDWKLNTHDLVNDRGMPGEGCINLKKIRDAVEAQGYSGPVEIEVFSKDNWWQKSCEEILDTSIATISKYC
jgi:sugar phosphate isomerase/epimerase